MNKSTIPTIFGLLIIIVSLVSGVVIIQSVQTFKSSASVSSSPHDLRVTNVKDTSFSISWMTDMPTIGFVKYTGQGVSNQTSPTSNSKVHFVNILNIKPDSTYTVTVNSGGQDFDSRQVQTITSYIPAEKLISGQVFNNKNLPAKDALVYIATDGVIKWSAQVSESGNFLTSLPALPDSTILQILVQNQDNTTADAQIDLASAHPIPTIVMGNSYDFRNQQNISATATPNVQITLP